MKNIEGLSLGQSTEYKNQYDKSLLVAIPRSLARSQIGLDENDISFTGIDIWNCYEVSWLNSKGKPEVRILTFSVPYDSTNISESKSVKLYLNSFNGSNFASEDEVLELIKQDIGDITGAKIEASFSSLHKRQYKIEVFDGQLIDDIDIKVNDYDINPDLLKVSEDYTEEVLYSNLLKSNCLVTNQPDWASVKISYKGKEIDKASLLQYIISFRNRNEFHEQCVEHIFNDIISICKPEELTVHAKYTRRGGVDINPYRTSKAFDIKDVCQIRDIRQ